MCRTIAGGAFSRNIALFFSCPSLLEIVPGRIGGVATREKAERLAKLSVQDPILYAIERRREANELNDTKVGRLHRRPIRKFAASDRREAAETSARPGIHLPAQRLRP